ncbi:MAG: hypothetical protein ACOX8X_01915 [Methanomethylophilus sp.]
MASSFPPDIEPLVSTQTMTGPGRPSPSSSEFPVSVLPVRAKTSIFRSAKSRSKRAESASSPRRNNSVGSMSAMLCPSSIPVISSRESRSSAPSSEGEDSTSSCSLISETLRPSSRHSASNTGSSMIFRSHARISDMSSLSCSSPSPVPQASVAYASPYLPIPNFPPSSMAAVVRKSLASVFIAMRTESSSNFPSYRAEESPYFSRQRERVSRRTSIRTLSS